ncbi:hypothetical protein C0J52_26412 [Blattella germanica]|nr:hypothetical protein C0J52_26412 [Blattella germanica]
MERHDRARKKRISERYEELRGWFRSLRVSAAGGGNVGTARMGPAQAVVPHFPNQQCRQKLHFKGDYNSHQRVQNISKRQTCQKHLAHVPRGLEDGVGRVLQRDVSAPGLWVSGRARGKEALSAHRTVPSALHETAPDAPRGQLELRFESRLGPTLHSDEKKRFKGHRHPRSLRAGSKCNQDY